MAGNVGNAQLTEKQQYSHETALQGHNIILTGQCGTGKTHLLRCIIKSLLCQGKKVSITATTGIASSHLGVNATTVHSWCGILDGRYSQTGLKVLVNSDECFSDATERIRGTDVLIIDEIGMASQEIFEMIEMVCRTVKQKDFLFGGLQVIASGDFKQLPPVPNIRYGDIGNHCFQSRVFTDLFAHHINLDVAVSLIMSDPDRAVEDLMYRTLYRIYKYNTILKKLIKLTAQAGRDCSGLIAAVHILNINIQDSRMTLVTIYGPNEDNPEFCKRSCGSVTSIGFQKHMMPNVALGICNQVEFIILCQANNIFEHTDITDILKVWKKKKD